jgi:hypothetical protein
LSNKGFRAGVELRTPDLWLPVSSPLWFGVLAVEHLLVCKLTCGALSLPRGVCIDLARRADVFVIEGIADD